MAQKKFKEATDHVKKAIDELIIIHRDMNNSNDKRTRAAGFAVVLNHLLEILNMQNPMILGQLANNLAFMKAEIQKEEEMAIVKSRPTSIFHEGGKQIH